MTTDNKTPKNKKGVVPTLLIILDGFGLADPAHPGNAITPETAPSIFGYMEQFPHSEIISHGEDVGLFPGQEGNSEAGHFNIGAGRVVVQDLVRITHAIEEGTFYKNESFHQALYHAQKYDTAVHLMGLLTNEQSGHAHPEHLYALLKYLRRQDHKKVFLHLFTDGRDSGPHSANVHLGELRKYMQEHEQIATIMGRFYAMDRDKRWDRTEQAYHTMVLGKGTCSAASAEEAITQGYNRGETDEYICPTVITKDGKPVATIEDNDAIFFFNTRSDRARQLTKAFVQPDFLKMNTGAFRRKRFPKNTRFVAMTNFGPDLPGIFTAFPDADLPNCLAAAIGEQRKQLYISETEKYAHVTYFLNGGVAEPIDHEDRETVRSTGDYSYEDHPGMKTDVVVQKIVDYLEEGAYNFIAVNFPNADMVGHTGDLEAAKRAVLIVDKHVNKLVKTVLGMGGNILITADHGNAELMLNTETGEMMTEHSINPVPCILISKEFSGVTLKNGRLADIAPTLLKVMGIDQPEEMTGKALF